MEPGTDFICNKWVFRQSDKTRLFFPLPNASWTRNSRTAGQKTLSGLAVTPRYRLCVEII